MRDPDGPGPGTANTPRARYPAVWTGAGYYDPGVSRLVTRAHGFAEASLAPVENPYAAAPNPIGHTLGGVLAGIAGGFVGGPPGAAAAVGAWEALYAYASGATAGEAAARGVVSGAVGWGAGKAVGYGISAAAGKFAARGAGGSGSAAQMSLFGADEVDNAPNLLYRVLRPDEDAALGLIAKNPAANYPLTDFVRNGSRLETQFISTTTSLEVAKSWALRHGSRIAVIDRTALNSATLFDLTNPVARLQLLTNPVARGFAAKSAEVVIHGNG